MKKTFLLGLFLTTASIMLAQHEIIIEDKASHLKVGDDMADGDLYDLEGNLHHLSELKGKYLLLDFWSRGCGPCIMAIPEMEKLQQKYADKLTVVSLSFDMEERWREASAEHPMTWKNWNEKKQSEGLYLKYGVNGIPHYVLISPEGKIVDSWGGYGMGLLFTKLRPYMYQKPKMSVEKKNGTLLVNYPECQTNRTMGILEIEKVECTSEATVLHLKAYYCPNRSIRIAETVSLKTVDGKQYKVVKTEGISLGIDHYMSQDGEDEFTMTFEPLPIDADVFTLQEGDRPDNFAIIGVKLMK